MDQLLTLLAQSLGTIIDDERVTRAMESYIASAVETRVKAEENRTEGHRHFSCFTPDDGKASK